MYCIPGYAAISNMTDKPPIVPITILVDIFNAFLILFKSSFFQGLGFTNRSIYLIRVWVEISGPFKKAKSTGLDAKTSCGSLAVRPIHK